MSAYSDAVLAHSPLVYWRLNETSGTTAADSSGNGNDGTINGSPTYSATGCIVDDSDTAMLLGVTAGEYVSFSGLASIVNSAAFTIFFHIDSLSATNDSLVEVRTSSSDYIIVQRSVTNSTVTVQYAKSGTSYYAVFSVASLTPCAMLAITFSAGDLALYVDGSAASLSSEGGTKDSPLFPSSVGIYLGRRASGDNNYGKYDEFAIVNSALSSTEVLALYNIAAAINPGETITPDLSAVVWLATNAVDLSATVNLDTQPELDLFAVVKLLVTESVDLSAAIDLDTTLVDLSAAIDLNPREVISPNLSATISLETASQALANAAGGYWLPVCLVDGSDVSSQLTGDANFEYEEDASGIGSVTLSPPDGTVDLTTYISKRLVYRRQDVDSAGTLQQQSTLFSGYISEAVFDPDTGNLVLECTTDLQGAFDGKTRGQIEAIVAGSWSPHVFEEGAQGYNYALDRMRTRTASIWHAPGAIVVTEWAAKETADIEFTDADVIEGSIDYEIATRRDLLNKVVITFDYRYQRMRQRTINVLFSMTQTFCDLLINGFKIPQRSMIESAANGGGWVVQGDIQYVDLPGAGTYRCFPFASGQNAAKYIGWGRLYLGYLLPDPDWDALCWGASWRAAKRWLQTITERHVIEINATQSQGGNGEIAKTESYSLSSTQDVSDWVDNERFSGTGTKSGFAAVGDSLDTGTYVLGDVARDAVDDPLTGRNAADLVRQVAIEAGVADELSSHRQNRVRWSTTFQPYVNLTKTARLNAYGFVAKGKVRRYTYSNNIESGDEEMMVEIALSRHFGSGLASTSTLTPDDPPDKPTETDIPRRKYLPSYVGGRTDTVELSESWDGYFTNYTWDATDDEPFAVDPSHPEAIYYPEQFICEYPEISGTALNAVELPAEQTIEVEIPEDEFTLTQ